MKLATTIIAVLACIWVSDAHKIHVARNAELGLTNAERMRRGQPLIPPTLRKRHHPKKPQASGSACPPLPCWTGVIGVTRSTDNAWLGYVSHGYNNDGAFTLTQKRNQAQLVEVPHNVYSFSQPFDLGTSLWSQDPRHSLIGAAGNDDRCYLGEGEAGFAYLTGVSHSNTRTPSRDAGHCMNDRGFPQSSHPSESGIWTLDCNSLEFDTHWTNKDTSEPDTNIIYSPGYRRGGFFGLTGDVDAFNARFNGQAVAVTFTFVPDCQPRGY